LQKAYGFLSEVTHMKNVTITETTFYSLLLGRTPVNIIWRRKNRYHYWLTKQELWNFSDRKLERLPRSKSSSVCHQYVCLTHKKMYYKAADRGYKICIIVSKWRMWIWTSICLYPYTWHLSHLSLLQPTLWVKSRPRKVTTAPVEHPWEPWLKRRETSWKTETETTICQNHNFILKYF
jgi:hypothetical protein